MENKIRMIIINGYGNKNDKSDTQVSFRNNMYVDGSTLSLIQSLWSFSMI